MQSTNGELAKNKHAYQTIASLLDGLTTRRRNKLRKEIAEGIKKKKLAEKYGLDYYRLLQFVKEYEV